MEQIILVVVGGGVGLVGKIIFDWLKNNKGSIAIEYEKRLTALETQQELKDKQIIEQSGRIEKKTDKIFDWLENLPCERHGERINQLEHTVNK